MSNALLSYGAWFFVPGLAAGWLQNLYYGLTVRAGQPKPTPGTPLFAKHHRIAKATVIIAYLVFTIYEAQWRLRQQPTFYELLGVTTNAQKRDIEGRFRRLSALHHPDKASSQADQAAMTAYYATLQRAKDTLADPVKRFAYDSYGPGILQLPDIKTKRDFVSFSGTRCLSYYVVAFLVQFGLSFVGLIPGQQFWRCMMLSALALFEFETLISSNASGSPWIATTMRDNGLPVPIFLPFQLVSLARQLLITGTIAYAQLRPLLSSQNPRQQFEGNIDRQVDALALLSRAAQQDAVRQQCLEVVPFQGHPVHVRDIAQKMQQWLVESTVRADPNVKSHIDEALAQRRSQSSSMVMDQEAGDSNS